MDSEMPKPLSKTELVPDPQNDPPRVFLGVVDGGR